MKIKKLGKKLTLNKQTIVNMKGIIAGYDSFIVCKTGPVCITDDLTCDCSIGNTCYSDCTCPCRESVTCPQHCG
jgi:hypothetical protein